MLHTYFIRRVCIEILPEFRRKMAFLNGLFHFWIAAVGQLLYNVNSAVCQGCFKYFLANRCYIQGLSIHQWCVDILSEFCCKKVLWSASTVKEGNRLLFHHFPSSCLSAQLPPFFLVFFYVQQSPLYSLLFTYGYILSAHNLLHPVMRHQSSYHTLPNSNSLVWTSATGQWKYSGLFFLFFWKERM